MEFVLVTMFAFVLAFAFYTLISQTFWLHFLTPYSTGLKPIAKVKNSSGTADRKTRIDTLWLPLIPGQTVYNGDAIATDASTTVEIEINPDFKILISPLSLVRLSSVNGQPLIQIKEGEVQADLKKDQTLLIKKGKSVRQVSLEKGDHKLNQLTLPPTHSSSSSSDVQPTEQESIKTEAKPEELPPPPPLAIATTENLPDSQISLPTPKKGTVFLINQPQDLFIAGAIRCPDRCELKIQLNGQEVFHKSFFEGESTVLKIKESDLRFGKYDWSFQTKETDLKSDFKIAPYSNDEFQNALKKGANVEIY